MKHTIRFIDSMYNTMFTIKDGERIRIIRDNGETDIRECKYIDDYHTKIGSNIFHIHEFAVVMEDNRSRFEPLSEGQ